MVNAHMSTSIRMWRIGYYPILRWSDKEEERKNVSGCEEELRD